MGSKLRRAIMHALIIYDIIYCIKNKHKDIINVRKAENVDEQ